MTKDKYKDVVLLSDDDRQVVRSHVEGLSDELLVENINRYKEMPTCLEITLEEILRRLKGKPNKEDPYITHKEFNDFKTEVLNTINHERLINTKRSKVAQDIISYELDAIKAQLPSLDRGALKSKNEERLKQFKEDIRNLRDVFKKN